MDAMHPPCFVRKRVHVHLRPQSSVANDGSISRFCTVGAVQTAESMYKRHHQTAAGGTGAALLGIMAIFSLHTPIIGPRWEIHSLRNYPGQLRPETLGWWPMNVGPRTLLLAQPFRRLSSAGRRRSSQSPPVGSGGPCAGRMRLNFTIPRNDRP